MYVNGKPHRRTQQERRKETRAALLRAARELFATQGFEATSTEQIVGTAQVTRGALYHHFQDKRDLFRAVLEDLEHEIDAGIAALVENARPRNAEEGWELYIRAHLVYLDLTMRPDIRRIALLEAPAVLGYEGWQAIDAAHALAQHQQGLENLMRLGLIRPLPPRATARLIHGALTEAALYVAHAPDPQSARLEAETALRSLLGGLRLEVTV
ncbi:AcrR family transcriptional regulator [Deinobacterium chartae]|uniref:AcrR family transcriptional regulator n=1 Tax=Deinobacterium chartae TaxID=521158 RepID=A0A841HZX2_9DEIO|nr:TetR/AcrR family transcriptional regulator [Deinobacterium chartae]MBB6097285.1 AcrR family transcriptional regulator [Deinobacterium chartae]